MSNRKQYNVIVIRRSCLTGKVVWLYRGPSKSAAHVAYHRACKAEIQRVRHWGETAAKRRSNIMRLLNECLDEIPITATLTPQQIEWSRMLRSISKEDIACHREFYDHIIEERRRRDEANKIRQQMRERCNCQTQGETHRKS